MTAALFRRSRLARWADDATLDRLEGEFMALPPEDRIERNRFIDEHSDADVRAFLGEAPARGRKSTRSAKEEAAEGAQIAEDAPVEGDPGT